MDDGSFDYFSFYFNNVGKLEKGVAGSIDARGFDVKPENLKKFKEVLLYILSKVGSKPNVGETVLYKLLYFIDFDYYEKFEEQFIGATYIKNHYGPTPIEFKKIVRRKNNNLTRMFKKYIMGDCPALPFPCPNAVVHDD